MHPTRPPQRFPLTPASDLMDWLCYTLIAGGGLGVAFAWALAQPPGLGEYLFSIVFCSALPLSVLLPAYRRHRTVVVLSQNGLALERWGRQEWQLGWIDYAGWRVERKEVDYSEFGPVIRETLVLPSRVPGGSGSILLGPGRYQPLLDALNRRAEWLVMGWADPVASDAASDARAQDQLQDTLVRLADGILHKAIDLGASEIHLNPGPDNVQIQVRVDGVLHDLISLSKETHPKLLARYKRMAELDLAERRVTREGLLRVDRRTGSWEFGVCSQPSPEGERLVMDMLKSTSRGTSG